METGANPTCGKGTIRKGAGSRAGRRDADVAQRRRQRAPRAATRSAAGRSQERAAGVRLISEEVRVIRRTPPS